MQWCKAWAKHEFFHVSVCNKIKPASTAWVLIFYNQAGRCNLFESSSGLCSGVTWRSPLEKFVFWWHSLLIFRSALDLSEKRLIEKRGASPCALHNSTHGLPPPTRTVSYRQADVAPIILPLLMPHIGISQTSWFPAIQWLLPYFGYCCLTFFFPVACFLTDLPVSQPLCHRTPRWSGIYSLICIGCCAVACLCADANYCWCMRVSVLS